MATCKSPNEEEAVTDETTETLIPGDKPPVTLVGGDGNAFSILAACKKAAKKAGWTPEQFDAFKTAATSGDYEHVIATAAKYFTCS